MLAPVSAFTLRLMAYRRLAHATSDPVAGSLLRMLIEDEDRHHGLFHAIASYLRTALDGRRRL